MFGTKLTNPAETLLTPKEKKKQFERKYKFQLILSVLITNTFLYFALNFLNSTSPVSASPKINPSPNHSPLELSLEISFPVDKNMQKIPISIYNQQKKQIVKKGFLYGASHSLINDQNKYIVEIHQNDLKTIILHQDQTLFAYPFGNYDLMTNKIKTRNNYEISF